MIDVIISAKKILSNYTEEEITKIKQDLTLPNPAYDAALRYSPYAKVALPKTLSYYEYVDGGIAVPRGYEIPFPHQVITDNRFENRVNFPKVKLIPRQMQIEAIESFAGKTDAMLISPTGSGKCQRSDTFVLFNDGFYKMNELKHSKIKGKISKLSKKLPTLNGEYEVENIYFGGEKETLKLTTNIGIEVEGTPEHPLLTISNGKYIWKTLSEFKVGDYLITKRGVKWDGEIKTFKVPQVIYGKNTMNVSEVILDEEFAFILGLLVAEGSCGKKDSISFCNKDETLVNIFKKFIEKYGLICKKNGLNYTVNSAQFRTLLLNMGINVGLSATKEIPISVRTSTMGVINSFIRGYMESECHISKPSNGTPSIEVSSASKILLNQLQIILFSFNIVSTVHSKLNKKYNRYYYRLNIADVIAYDSMFPFVTRSQRIKIEDSIKTKKENNPNIDLIPNIEVLLKSLELSLKYTTHSDDRRKLNTYASGNRRCSYKTLDEFIKFGQRFNGDIDVLSELVSIKNKNYFYSKIERIEKSASEVMDLYVPLDESYLGNSVISHNSTMVLLLLAKINNKALVVVHKDDLVSGWIDDIQKCFSLRYRQAGLIKAQSYSVGKWITVTTIQTLSKLPEEKIEELKKEFGVIVVDELHHVGAKIYNIVEKFPAKYRIGVTATPMRNDGLGEVMFFYFGKPCFTYKESEENKDIIPPSKVLIKRKIVGTTFNPSDVFIDSFSLKKINTYNIDYENLRLMMKSGRIKRKPMDYHQARRAIQEDTYFTAQICADVKAEFANGKSCLIFCFEKEHCRTIYQKLLELGVPSNKIQLYYGDAKESKDEMKRKAESREVLITIATYAIGTEGTNVRAWERMFLAMTIGNAKDTIQAIGRGRRTFSGKNDLIVYDYVFPNVKGIRNHWKIREAVYKEIGFKIS